MTGGHAPTLAMIALCPATVGPMTRIAPATSTEIGPSNGALSISRTSTYRGRQCRDRSGHCTSYSFAQQSRAHGMLEDYTPTPRPHGDRATIRLARDTHGLPRPGLIARVSSRRNVSASAVAMRRRRTTEPRGRSESATYGSASASGTSQSSAGPGTLSRWWPRRWKPSGAAATSVGVEGRLKQARLAWIKTLDQFEFEYQPSIDRKQVRELAGLSFIDRTQNVVLLGPPGVGKTHSSRSHWASRRWRRAPRCSF